MTISTTSLGSSAGMGTDQGLAIDAGSISQLKMTASKTPQAALAGVSKQFESLFLNMVLKSMRDATPSDGPFDSQTSKVYTSMLDQQLAQTMSGHGIGLADAMQRQLQKFVTPASSDDTPLDTSLIQKGMPLQNAQRSMPLNPADNANFQPVAPQWSTQPVRRPDLSLYQQSINPDGRGGSAVGAASSGSVNEFVSRMTPAAQAASQSSGVPAQLILAQAALESGWGRREIRAPDGSATYNVFGIKATPDWKGPTVQVATTEYVNGTPQKTTASFRAYDSYESAFSDYASFLTKNPRYAGVVQKGAGGNAEEVAYGLQRAGYATDPEYGSKLVRIMRQVT